MNNVFTEYGSNKYNPFPLGDYRYNVYDSPNGTVYIPKGNLKNFPNELSSKRPMYKIDDLWGAAVSNQNSPYMFEGIKTPNLTRKREKVLSKPIVAGFPPPLEHNPNDWRIGISALPNDNVSFDRRVVKDIPNISSVVREPIRRFANMPAVGYGAPATYEASLDDKEIMPVMTGRDKLGKTIYETVPTTESGNYYLDPVTDEITKTKITTDSQGNRWYRNKSVNRDVPLDVGVSIEDIIRHLFR